MLVSIIIPVYNAAQTIAATLTSALKQKSNLFETEIIIIDDGSTDATPDILKNYQHKCFIITQDNTGASAARQTGFEISKGNYIQYLDSDDLLSDGKIELQFQKLIKNNADIAYGDFEKFSEKNNKLIIEQTITGAVNGKPEITVFKNFWRPPAAILYSRNIAKKICWSKNLPIIQDARYLLDAVLMGGKLIYTPGIVAGYRINQSQSLSQCSKLNFVKDCFLNTSEIYAIWKNDLETQLEKKTALIESLRYCVTEFSVADHQLFNQAIDVLLQISPGYIPQKSLPIKLLSLLFGYRNAEKLALLRRKLR